MGGRHVFCLVQYCRSVARSQSLRTSALKHSCNASFHVTPLFQVQFNQYSSQGCTGYTNRAASEPQHVLQSMGVQNPHRHHSSAMFSLIRKLSSGLHSYDSASNRNEYQESSWGVKGGRRVGLTNLPPSVSRLSKQNMGASTFHNPMGLHGLL
jgi:hypothetical protein